MVFVVLKLDDLESGSQSQPFTRGFDPSGCCLAAGEAAESPGAIWLKPCIMIVACMIQSSLETCDYSNGIISSR
jgi:hypothetical protein